jgi:hypothetical protein
MGGFWCFCILTSEVGNFLNWGLKWVLLYFASFVYIWMRFHLHKYHKCVWYTDVSLKNYLTCSKCDIVRSKILCHIHNNNFNFSFDWWWLLVELKHVALKPCSVQKELSCVGLLLLTWEQKHLNNSKQSTRSELNGDYKVTDISLHWACSLPVLFLRWDLYCPGNVQMHIQTKGISPLKTKRILSNIKTQGGLRSKHSPPQFKEPIIWWRVR